MIKNSHCDLFYQNIHNSEKRFQSWQFPVLIWKLLCCNSNPLFLSNIKEMPPAGLEYLPSNLQEYHTIHPSLEFSRFSIFKMDRKLFSPFFGSIFLDYEWVLTNQQLMSWWSSHVRYRHLCSIFKWKKNPEANTTMFAGCQRSKLAVTQGFLSMCLRFASFSLRPQGRDIHLNSAWLNSAVREAQKSL